MTTKYDVRIEIDAGAGRGAYKPIWNWFGYDEPNYTYTENGRKLLKELTELSPEPPRIRTHNLLTSGDGKHALKWGSTNAYTEDADGNAVYDWTILDQIFDTYVEAGNIPFVQVGFTPEALAGCDGLYRHSWSLEDRSKSITAGWAWPPNDLEKWGKLIHAWARHLADRYGEERVRSWPWEVWNEPDGLYWTGSIRQFCDMYAVTAKAIKAAIPGARVGGPHTCGAFNNEKASVFLREFLQYVSDNDTPIDFVAYHAKGQPTVQGDHVQMGLHKQLKDIEMNLAIQNEFPKLRHLPAILGESDPEGCAACSARVFPQNGYRNGPLYGVYAVQSMIRTYELAQRAGIEIEGAVTWAFLFEDQPWFDGFRDLATNGVDKAVLNGFRMLGKLGGEWVETRSDHHIDIETIMEKGVRDRPDVNAVATRDDKGVSILVWHYHDDDVAGPTADVTLSLTGLEPGRHRLTHFRMDHDHSNAYRVWKEMGSPEQVVGADFTRLEAAGKLETLETGTLDAAAGAATLTTTLPRQGVSLIRIDY